MTIMCVFRCTHYQVNQVLSEIDNFRQSLSLGQNLTDIVNLVCTNTKYTYVCTYVTVVASLVYSLACVCLVHPNVYTICTCVVRAYIRTYVPFWPFAQSVHTPVIVYCFRSMER